MKSSSMVTITLFRVILLSISFQGFFALRNMHIRVPEVVRMGDTVTLSCYYDLEDVALYSIKWYKYDIEFYRYVPKESPPSKVFPIPYITVDMSRSNAREVTLTEVVRETAGTYKCEVSADAPLFHTEIRSAHMLVAEIPDEGPVLRTELQNVTPGAKVRVNCTTPGSYPPMNVTWLINEKEIQQKNFIEIHQTIENYDALPGLGTVRSIITLKTYPELFQSGKIKLSCIASLYNLYRQVSEVEVAEDRRLMALVMVPTTSDEETKGLANGSKELFRIPLKAWLLYGILTIWLR
ncbi:uncharacterized protein [Onthophagus taurus]|uniref:uncharacterized protein n=1 Tax=Onthophagus taurus TaxID=166361 RepID=UPI000C1FE3F3|nr:uncharacterized protein LOC111428821 [Onthophagus taurus]